MLAWLNIENNFNVWIKCGDGALVEIGLCFKSQFVSAPCQ